MSWNPALDPQCPTGAGGDAIRAPIIPRARSIGGFALPSTCRQMVPGPLLGARPGPAGRG